MLKKKILVVDDSSIMRSAIKGILKSRFDVTDVKDAPQALKAVVNEHYSLIITDLNMPQMDGMDFIRNLKNISTTKFTPVIVLSTDSQRSRIEMARDLGCKAYIIKPFSEAQLVDAVERLILK
jgi:two-component system chemotaxis response regulator CheY